MVFAEQLFDNDEIRANYLAHFNDLRGKVRTAVVRRHLHEVGLAESGRRLRILDVGCGDGRDSIWLAGLGHDVTGVDTAEGMIEAAVSGVADKDLAGSVEFVSGDVAFALDRFGPENFDLVLSHGVLMYQDDPPAFIAQHLELVRDGGLLSLLTKNADALAFRAAREASIDEAMMVLDDWSSTGHLGLTTGAHTIQNLADIGFRSGATVRSWAGVRTFSDTPTDPLLEATEEEVIDLEWSVALRDPHRRVGALLHVLLMRGVDMSLLPVQ
jgi:2-polyprenyl-3-methyl-5-hydroxy-6-metoxy-1,4-benzoquinol methylase